MGFVDNSDVFKAAMDAKIEELLEGVGIFVEGEAVDLLNKPMPHADGTSHPYIDTGNLRGSINHRYVPTEKAVHIGTDVEYGIYIHQGTSKIKPNRFLREAVELNADQIRTYIKNGLKA